METERSDRNQAASPKGPASPDSLGLSRLAQRISSYTSKGIVSAVVLVAGLGFGRQVLSLVARGRAAAHRVGIRLP